MRSWLGLTVVSWLVWAGLVLIYVRFTVPVFACYLTACAGVAVGLVMAFIQRQK